MEKALSWYVSGPTRPLGRLISLPANGESIEDRLGRLTSLPANGESIEDRQGRLTSLPANGESIEDRLGRLTSLPANAESIEDPTRQAHLSACKCRKHGAGTF